MHINKSNKKKYIGITKREPIIRFGKDGKGYCHSVRFYNAIKKYGWDNFEHKILFCNLTKKQAETKEIELIKEYKTTDRKFGYNISKGGTGGNNKKEIAVKKYDLEGNYICTYKNAAEAALDVNGNRSCITHCCKSEKSKYKYKNYMWCYANEIITEPYSRRNWKKIEQYSMVGEFIKTFKSVYLATKEVKGDMSAITRCANNKQNYAYGYKWKWEG